MQRPPRFTHRTTEALFAYWDRRRGDRVAPERSEIEPSDIRTILPDTFILEEDERGKILWRLGGTRVCALHCRELKGRDFLVDWIGAEKETISGLIEAVRKEGAVAILQFDGQNRRKSRLQHEMVLLPLDVFGRNERRVLGAVVPMEQPYWIGIEPASERKITGMRLLWPSLKPKVFGQSGVETVPRVVPEAMPDFASVFAPERPANRPSEPPVLRLADNTARRVRHLMVFDGGKATPPQEVTPR